jgi:hypothetical protein
MNLGRMGKGFGKLGAPVKAGTGDGSPPAGRQTIGLLIVLTKAA